MTWPIVELTFWSPGDSHNPRIDPLLANPATPLAKHGLTGIAAAYARETGVQLHETHRQWAEHLTGRSLGVDGALADVVGLFDDRGFEYFIAKGPAIAHTLYPDAGLRPYCDLDVYVGAAHEPAARAALADAGYDSVQHAVGVLGGLAQEMHGGPYGATVELHAHVVDNLHRRHLPAVEAFLPYVQRRQIAGIVAPTLSEGAHLALQAIHAGAAHRYSKLILLRDLEITLRHEPEAPKELAVDVYLTVAAGLLGRLGRSPVRRHAAGTLARPTIAGFARRDPLLWDEYQLSVENVLAFANQTDWKTSLRCIGAAVRSLPRRRGRRVPLRRPPSNTASRPTVPYPALPRETK